MPRTPWADDSATSPVVGVVLLVALTVVLASGVAVAFAVDVGEPAPAAQVSLTVDADRNRLALTHEGGDALAVAELQVVVTVDGERLRHQPPVPFFSATGFVPGPTGPFNRGYDGSWTAGERATVALAGTNAPTPASGDRVTVTLAADGVTVATATAIAQGTGSNSERKGSGAGPTERVRL